MSSQDPRVPVDRSETTRSGMYYAHVTKGNCSRHGITACECIHMAADAKEGDLILECLICRSEQAFKEENR